VGVQAHEVLHVGDDAHLDVVGAVGCGMQAVWVNRDGHDWHARLAAQGAAHHAHATPHLTVQTLSQLCDRVLNPRCGL